MHESSILKFLENVSANKFALKDEVNLYIIK